MGHGVEGPAARAPLAASATRLAARLSISSAARRVKVSSRMRSGAVPRSSRQATRATKARVLPVPAPATTTSGPSPWLATAN